MLIAETGEIMKQQYLYVKSTPKQQKRKLEFMQITVLIALLLPFVWVSFSYVLAWYNKVNTLESLSGVVVSVPVSAIVGYVSQNCVRAKWFKDKTANKEVPEPEQQAIQQNVNGGNIRGC